MPNSEILNQQFKLQAIYDSVIMGIMVLRADGTIKSANKTCCQIIGKAEEEISHRNITEFLIPASQSKFADYMEQVIEGEVVNTRRKALELEIINPSGNHMVELNITSRLEMTQHHYVALLNDFSHEKELEVEYKKEYATRQKVENELQKEQELSELKSRFVSMASHEFRTPLAGILSSVNLMKRYLADELKRGNELYHKKKIETHFGKIKELVTNLNRILNEFLSVGKLEEGKIDCLWEKVDLHALIDQVSRELNELLKPNQQIIVQNQLPQSCYVLDKNMTQNIFTNLVMNAIKYSSAGDPITVGLWAAEKQLFFTVKDEGIGIPETDQDKLFSRFFRAKNVTNIEGTGLGLNIIKRFAQLMGGDITFTSTLGQGTTFKVEIPIKDEY